MSRKQLKEYKSGSNLAFLLVTRGADGEAFDWYRSEPAVTGRSKLFHEGFSDEYERLVLGVG